MQCSSSKNSFTSTLSKFKDIANGTLMLCSKCNSGEWHGEISRTKANEYKYYIASFSSNNMITPYDRTGCEFVRDETKRYGYSLKKKKDTSEDI